MELQHVKGLQKLLAQLQAKAAKTGYANPVVLVGYTAAYAIYVHENLEMKLRGKPRPSGLGQYWGPVPKAGPKFLEAPARTLQRELAGIIAQSAAKGKSLGQALVLAGLRLQRGSMQLVPVEYGVLKASAFTRIEDG